MYQNNAKDYGKPIAELAKTPAGKTICLYYNPNGVNLYFVRFLEGGELPPELDQYFTGKQEADHYVQVYLARKFPKPTITTSSYIPQVELQGEKVKGKRLNNLEKGLQKVNDEPQDQQEHVSSIPEPLMQGSVPGLVKLGMPSHEPEFETVNLTTVMK